jgi:flagellar biosynthesis protein FlhF
MKIRRFQGANVRNVLGQVREALGPDAVILSNRRDGAGVEIVAATDYDEASVWQAAARPGPGQAASPPAGDGRGCGVSQAVPEPSSPGLDEVREELSRIKSLLEERIDGLSWRRWLRHHPQHRAACQELQSLDLSPGAIRHVLSGLGTAPDGEQSRREAMVALVRLLSVPVDDPLSQGGIVALVGTTGVGKTTTLAKLAARQVLARGPQSVRLVSSDGHRIGAHEQLITYGRLLGVGVHVAETADELRHVLGELSHVPLVLVDSAGMGQRDRRLIDQLQRLRSVADRLRAYVVLPASAPLDILEQTIMALGPEHLAGALISKLDEALSLGPILSVLIRHRLGAAYLANGQRVPEDLLRVRPADLVLRARAYVRQHRMAATRDAWHTARAG